MRLASAATLALAVGLFVLATAPGLRASSVSHLRILDPGLQSVIAGHLTRSPTLRTLIAAVEASDVIAHVLPSGPHTPIAGALRWVTATPHNRIVRIWIDRRLPAPLQVSVFAHELQHVLEVARSPQVVDRASFERLYRGIGRQVHCPGCFDTEDAIRTGRQVLAELRRVAAAN